VPGQMCFYSSFHPRIQVPMKWHCFFFTYLFLKLSRSSGKRAPVRHTHHHPVGNHNLQITGDGWARTRTCVVDVDMKLEPLEGYCYQARIK